MYVQVTYWFSLRGTISSEFTVFAPFSYYCDFPWFSPTSLYGRALLFPPLLLFSLISLSDYKATTAAFLTSYILWVLRSFNALSAS